MAPVTRIRSSEVSDAIEKLLSLGQTPTHMSVRESLGGRGSGPVLSKFIARWFAENGPAFFDKAKARSATADIRSQFQSAADEALRKLDATQAERVAALEARASALDQRDVDLLTRETRLDQRESAQAGWIAELQASAAASAERAANAERLASALANQVAALEAAAERDAVALAKAEEGHAASLRGCRDEAASRKAAEAREEGLAREVARLHSALASEAASAANARQTLQAERDAHDVERASWEAQRHTIGFQLDEARRELQQLLDRVLRREEDHEEAAGASHAREKALQERLAKSEETRAIAQEALAGALKSQTAAEARSAALAADLSASNAAVAKLTDLLAAKSDHTHRASE
ncbi:DNA-binding protein [Xanthomonas arboricola]|uniref:Chromosome segregation ATPase n=1 Tax=Xanthomonas arboricola TaxID=56448 RepID=A0AB73H1T5_9XANT|nr:DNA-binding protein [Xanthomonas arboricola]MBB5672349.1 chromosome segregation ATPase [Xanthomonas arboricola]